MRVVVLTGGQTKRMLPLTEGYSRALLNIMGKPLFMYPLQTALKVVAGKGLVVTSSDTPLGEIIRHLQATGLSAHVSVKTQQEPGIEGALLASREFTEGEEWFMLAYGDVIVNEEAFRLVLDVHAGSGRPSALLIPSSNIQSFGSAIVRENMITRFLPGGSSDETSYVVGGIFILPSEFFSLLKNDSSFFEALNQLIEKTGVYAAFWTGDWIAVDYPWDLINALYSLIDKKCGKIIAPSAKVSPTAILEGCVIIDEGATVDHYAVIKGPVYIGRNSFIGMGAFIREYTSIEENVVVGAYSEIKRSVLQPFSTVGSFSLITDSVFGYGSVAEPRTTVISMLPENFTAVRELPLQGIVGKKKKLGAFVSPYARIKSGTVLGPAVKVHRDGHIEGVQ
ncbi:sugar phosphate nucleotidyltransferase [Infirmifilum sp.]|uniref:sugar phosphate nucleotidyltransferase n=1 Tax=Infirmifilum sp. TaxID=2856575 RepID=UPI003D0B37C3